MHKSLSKMVLLSLFLYFCCVTAIFGHDYGKKWGTVPKEIKEMKTYAQDTSAAAIFIFDIGELQVDMADGASMTLKRHYQIKILKESGKKYADIDIPYYYEDKIDDLKVQTILPNGKKIKVNKKDIFDEQEKEHYKLKRIAAPGATVGAIIEVKYTLFSEYVLNLESWFFQYEIPNLESVMVVQVAPGFDYSAFIKNDFYFRIKQETEQYIDLDYQGLRLNRFIYRGVRIPAIKEEPYVACLNDYRAHLEFQLRGYKNEYVDHTFVKNFKTLHKELLENLCHSH